MPNGEHITSSHVGELEIAGEMEDVHLFAEEHLVGMSLLSVGKLCDRGMSVTYTKGEVTVLSVDGQTVIQGWRDSATGVYLIDISTSGQAPLQPQSSNWNR